MGPFDSVTFAVIVVTSLAACGVTMVVGLIRATRQRRAEKIAQDRRIFVVCERQK